MPIRKTNKQVTRKSENEIVHAEQAVEVIEKRVTNVETLTNTLQNLVMKGLESFGDYITKRDEADKRQGEYEDKQHRRGVWLIVYLVAVVFVLAFTALLMKEENTFKEIIQGAIAIGAGTGIASLLPPRRNHGKKDDD